MSARATVVSAALLSAGVAAAVAAVTVRLADGGPRIATVRLAEIVAERAGDAARSDLPPAESAAAARAWAAALEDALADLARDGRTVLLPARTVVAGAPDLTDSLRHVLAWRLEYADEVRERRR